MDILVDVRSDVACEYFRSRLVHCLNCCSAREFGMPLFSLRNQLLRQSPKISLTGTSPGWWMDSTCTWCLQSSHQFSVFTSHLHIGNVPGTALWICWWFNSKNWKWDPWMLSSPSAARTERTAWCVVSGSWLALTRWNGGKRIDSSIIRASVRIPASHVEDLFCPVICENVDGQGEAIQNTQPGYQAWLSVPYRWISANHFVSRDRMYTNAVVKFRCFCSASWLVPSAQRVMHEHLVARQYKLKGPHRDWCTVMHRTRFAFCLWVALCAVWWSVVFLVHVASHQLICWRIPLYGIHMHLIPQLWMDWSLSCMFETNRASISSSMH